MRPEQPPRNRVPRGLWIWVALTVLLAVGCARTPSRPSPPPTAERPEARKPPTPKSSKPYRVGRNWYHPIPHAHGFSERGVASWYGKKFHGRKTSSGEVYNMYAMTAAHKTLPLGTWVRVTHLKTGRSVDVRVNDRGPFIRGRIIDLSYTAAKKLDMIGPGTAPVEIVALGAAATEGDTAGKRPAAFVPVDYQTGNFTFQVGAFKNRQNALQLKQVLDRKYKNAHITEYDSPEGVYYRVRVGLAKTLAQAEAYEQQLVADGFDQAFIVAE